MKFCLKKRPDFHSFYANGGVDLDPFLPEMAGDVKNLRLLDTCCSGDASQAFSWSNLGASVTACDISPVAIRIARENASIIGSNVVFIEEDAQYLSSVQDDSFDIVFATYPVWFSDIGQACRTWRRVLRKGGKLLFHFEHPISYCIEEKDGTIQVLHNYNCSTSYHFDEFVGTPLADMYGGWRSQTPSVEHFYRLSDLINAVLRAPLTITEVREPEISDDGTLAGKLPQDFVILAVK